MRLPSRALLAAIGALGLVTACERQAADETTDLAGRWQVQQIAGASLGEGVDIWFEVNGESGVITGFTGCNNFTATLSTFQNVLAIGNVAEEPGECASEAAATDEARFLGVLPHVQRHVRRGASLELLDRQAGSEALLRLRNDEVIGG